MLLPSRGNRKLQRSILELAVVRTRRTDRISIAEPGDFVCRPAAAAPEIGGAALPYCLDFVRGRAIYVAGVEVAALEAAPFYYLHLRRTARRLLAVPIEHGSLNAAPAYADPVFVFSPGRCGSTLLSGILAHAGVRGVSEPDFYTQMSSLFWSYPRNPLREPFRRAMWAMTQDLAAALGGAPVVKLRAESCRAPELFVRSPQARAIVLVRGFEGWARSTARIFGAGPGKSVRKYMRALSCFAYLRRNAVCHLLRYEDLVADPETTCAALSRFLGVDVAPEAAASAAAHNSQQGTPLEPERHRQAAGWEAKFDAAMRLWRSPRLVDARARLDIPNVWEGEPTDVNHYSQ